MATSDMYKSDGKENLLILNKTNSAAQYPGATVYADGAVYTSDSDKWNADTVKQYTASTLPDPATLGVGETGVLTGAFAADVTAVSLTVDFVKGVKAWTGTVISANAPSNSDGLPNGVTWIKV